MYRITPTLATVEIDIKMVEISLRWRLLTMIFPTKAFKYKVKMVVDKNKMLNRSTVKGIAQIIPVSWLSAINNKEMSRVKKTAVMPKLEMTFATYRSLDVIGKGA